MCQMVVFWYTCGHFILSTLKCPFDGANTHEEDTTTTALVDYECWLCKQGPDHLHWARIERMKSVILTVSHLEIILDVSSYDADFLARVAGFYARGDHKRWAQPGEAKAKYFKKDPYIVSLELEMALAQRGEKKLPMKPGLVFDLEFAMDRRFDIARVETLFWPLREWRPPSAFFYSSSAMMNFLPSANQSCDGEMDYAPPPQFASRHAFGSKASDLSGSSSSATYNTWNTATPPLTVPNTLPGFCDNVSDWMQLQGSDTSTSETHSSSLISDQLFGFDPCGLNDAAMLDLYPSGLQVETPLNMNMNMNTGIAIKAPPAPYQMPSINFNLPSYPTENPIQTPDPSTSASAELLPFGYTTPILPPRPKSSSASMSPMSSICHTEDHQQQHQQQPINQTPFEPSCPNLFLSASIPAAHILHSQMAQDVEKKPRKKKASPAKGKSKQQQRSSNELFCSHGRPDMRYLTPQHSGTSSVPVYETPDEAEAEASEKMYSTRMDTDSSSPSPSLRAAKGRWGGTVRQVEVSVAKTPVQSKSVNTKNGSSGSRKRKRENGKENMAHSAGLLGLD